VEFGPYDVWSRMGYGEGGGGALDVLEKKV